MRPLRLPIVAAHGVAVSGLRAAACVLPAIALLWVCGTARADGPSAAALAQRLASAPSTGAPVLSSLINMPNGIAGLDGLARVTAPLVGNASAAGITLPSSTTQRSLSARAADAPWVGDYGAAMSGTINDTAAFSMARTVLPDGATIGVPYGPWNISANPSGGGAAGDDTWLLHGNQYAAGAPVQYVGNDLTENYYLGTHMFEKVFANASSGPIVRLDALWTGAGSAQTIGSQQNALQANCIVRGPTNAAGIVGGAPWCGLFIATSSAIGGANVVPLAASAFRPANTLADGFGPRAPLWGLNAVAQDSTGMPSNLAGSMDGLELDMYADGDDPPIVGVDNGNRVAWQAVIGSASSTHARIGRGLEYDGGTSPTNPTSYVGTAYSANIPWDTAGFDFTHGGSVVLTRSTATAQSAAGTLLAFASVAGVRVGMTVSGVGVASGTTVIATTQEGYGSAPTANAPPTTNGTVTLSTTTTAAVPSGTTITFAANAPAIAMSANQTLCLDSVLPYGGAPALASCLQGDTSGRILIGGPVVYQSNTGFFYEPTLVFHEYYDGVGYIRDTYYGQTFRTEDGHGNQVNYGYVAPRGSLITSQTGAYTFAAADCGSIIRDNAAAAHSLTVPTGLPLGCHIGIVQVGTGAPTVVGASGVTIEAASGAATPAAQYARISVLVDTASTANVAPGL